MIRLMVVDDEADIRQGLRQAVRWMEYGVEIVGEARSGAEALEKARTLRPDIVITDIRMSEGDGLSLVKRLPEILPGVRMIMLSGYSDMEYMMEAIKHDVRDYLLKPAGSAEILNSVLKLRDEILLEQRKKQQSSRIEHLINENLDALKALFLEELLSGRPDEASVRERARTLGVALPGPVYALLLVRPKENRRWELLQLLSSQLEPFRPTVHRCPGGEIAAILNAARAPEEAQLKELIARLGGLADPMALPCVGWCESLESLGALRDACEGMQSRSLWFPDRRCLWAEAGQIFAPMPEEELLALERAIVQSVRLGNFAALSEDVQALFALFGEAKPPRAQFQEALLGMARSIRVFSEDAGLHQALEALFLGPYTVEQAKAALLDRVNDGYAEYGPQVRNALTYMAEHLDQDISLTDVAQVLYISPSYLTRLIKNKTGRGFNEWLHLIRIGKAKELLETSSLHHYEIAERVGYRSYKIFSEYFSKLVGMSARSYRDGVSRKGAQVRSSE